MVLECSSDVHVETDLNVRFHCQHVHFLFLDYVHVTHHCELYIYNIPVYILWVLIGSDLNFCPNDMQRYKHIHHFVLYSQ